MIFKYLPDIIQAYFDCTALSITAFSQNHEPLASSSEPTHLILPSELIKTYNTLSPITHSILKAGEATFIMTPFDRNDKGLGYFLLGPYTSIKDASIPYHYKPEICIPSLVELVYNIVEAIADTSFSSQYSSYVNDAIKLMHERFHENLDLETLTKELNINKCYFCNLFKKDTGKTYSKYMNELRIEHSKEHLRMTNGSILDIALHVGYNNQNYFTMMFKKYTGMTPLEYRKTTSNPPLK